MLSWEIKYVFILRTDKVVSLSSRVSVNAEFRTPTHWPATCGTLRSNCATQLSIVILVRTDMMEQHRCLCVRSVLCKVPSWFVPGPLQGGTAPTIFVAADVRPGGPALMRSPSRTHSLITSRRSRGLNAAGRGPGQSVDQANEKL